MLIITKLHLMIIGVPTVGAALSIEFQLRVDLLWIYGRGLPLDWTYFIKMVAMMRIYSY
jgi:hypothetical protein